jgi:hypothetical protein
MKQKGITPRHLTSNSAPIDMSGVRIEVLNPWKGPPPGEDLNDREINERALVLQLRWGDTATMSSSGTGRQGPPSSARTCTGPSASPRTGAVTRSFPSKAHDLYCLSWVNVLENQVQNLLLGVMPS